MYRCYYLSRHRALPSSPKALAAEIEAYAFVYIKYMCVLQFLKHKQDKCVEFKLDSQKRRNKT